MAKVLLTSTAPPDDPTRPYPYDELRRMERSARRDKFGVHTIVDDPADAGIVLFVENCDPIRHYFELRQNPYFRNFQEKCFMFCRYDLPVPFLPGVYASISGRWYSPQRTRSGPYLNAFDHDFITPVPDDEEPQFLYSFLGQRSTHPIREKLFALGHPDQYVFDTSPFWPYGELNDDDREELEQQYVSVSHRSRFILCPRGRGASSIRLFECMRMGRAPVIISDAWVPPEGPDWNAFSIRVAERDILKIPSLLEQRVDQAEAMGIHAREVWEDWFSEEATFHRVTEWCLDILRERKLPERLLRLSVVPQLLRPLYFRALVRTLLPAR